MADSCNRSHIHQFFVEFFHCQLVEKDRGSTLRPQLTIYRNCDVLPLCFGDLLNHTTLMLKFCTNKPMWALLLRQVFFWGGGEGLRFAPKKGVTLHPRAMDFQEKKSFASSIRIVSYCKYDMYLNK